MSCRIRSYFLMLGIFVATACERNTQSHPDELLAAIGDNKLFLSEIIIPSGLSESDSIAFLKRRINDWIIRQAYYQKALENLDDSDGKIARMVQEYKVTLYIHKYKQLLLRQKVDSVVSPNEVSEYYSKFSDQFLLKQPYVKAFVIIVPASHTKQAELLKLLNNYDEKNIGDLKDICYQNVRYFNLENKWRAWSTVMNEAGVTTSQIAPRNISKGRVFEFPQNETIALIKVIDYIPANSISPIEIVYDDIVNLVLHKRREKFLQKLENEMLQNIIREQKIYRQFSD